MYDRDKKPTKEKFHLGDQEVLPETKASYEILMLSKVKLEFQRSCLLGKYKLPQVVLNSVGVVFKESISVAQRVTGLGLHRTVS